MSSNVQFPSVAASASGSGASGPAVAPPKNARSCSCGRIMSIITIAAGLGTSLCAGTALAVTTFAQEILATQFAFLVEAAASLSVYGWVTIGCAGIVIALIGIGILSQIRAQKAAEERSRGQELLVESPGMSTTTTIAATTITTTTEAATTIAATTVTATAPSLALTADPAALPPITKKKSKTATTIAPRVPHTAHSEERAAGSSTTNTTTATAATMTSNPITSTLTSTTASSTAVSLRERRSSSLTPATSSTTTTTLSSSYVAVPALVSATASAVFSTTTFTTTTATSSSAAASQPKGWFGFTRGPIHYLTGKPYAEWVNNDGENEGDDYSENASIVSYDSES